jgi:hypothetical protein
MRPLAPIAARADHNYVAFFLTLGCGLRCPYCINLHEMGAGAARPSVPHMGPDAWVRAADRMRLRPDLPITLQGGEPTSYHGFYRIVAEADPVLKMDLLTNMQFDVEEFVARVPVERFTRDAPYAPIRVTYHPGQNELPDLVRKTHRLSDAGFRVGLYGILHPEPELARPVREAQALCAREGLDFRFKEFLGTWRGRLHGTYRYAGAVSGGEALTCECRTSEWLVSPTGHVHRCHTDLYDSLNPLGHILDLDLSADLLDPFRPCSIYGHCNPCDTKVKTDRFQRWGHTSVTIRHGRAPQGPRVAAGEGRAWTRS